MSNYKDIPDINSRFDYWEKVLNQSDLKQRSLKVGYKCIIPKIPKNTHINGVQCRINRATNWLNGLRVLEYNRGLDKKAFNRATNYNIPESKIEQLRKRFNVE